MESRRSQMFCFLHLMLVSMAAEAFGKYIFVEPACSEVDLVATLSGKVCARGPFGFARTISCSCLEGE